MRALFLLLVSLVVVVTAAACSSDRASTERGASPAALAPNGPRVKPPADLAPSRATGGAFVASGDGLVANGGTHESKVARDGTLEIVPRTSPVRPGPHAAARGKALTLSTIAMMRGTRAIDVRGEAFLDGGAVVIRRDAVVERLVDEGTGIEQSWHFDRAPSGEGDLVVRVAAAGERFRGATDHGLHFDGEELGVRYGVATWVDARGARTTIVPRFVDGVIEIAVPEDVLARSTFPAVLDPTIGAEREVDVPAAVTPAPGDQSIPAITPLGPGQGYFAVWHDRRSVRPAFVGSRIGANGTVLDPTGVTIVSGVSTTAQQPVLYTAPNGLLLLWTVYNYDQWQDPGIYALRLDTTGKALDAAPIPIVKNTPNLASATAAFDGTNWLIGWSRYSQAAAAYQVLAVRLSAAGVVLDAQPIVLVQSKIAGYSPLLTFDGADFFLTWLGSTGIYGQRIGKDTKAIGTEALLASSPYVYDYATAFNGTQHFVVWYEYNGGYVISAVRVDKQGQPVDGVRTTLPTANAYVQRPRVEWDGTSFLVAWVTDSLSIVGARVSTTGALVDGTAQKIFTTPNYLYDYAFACDAPDSVVVYRDFSATGGSGSNIGGVKVTSGAGLTAGTPFVVSAASNSETDAATAWNGTTYFSVWIDTREKQPTVWGAPISADGTPGTAVRLFGNPDGVITYSSFSAPRIASNGQSFFVTFAANQSGCADACLFRSVFGFVVDASGTIQGKGIVDLVPSGGAATAATSPDVAWSGAEYLVVYEESSDGVGIAGRRVRPDATPVDDKTLRISPLTPGSTENRRAPSVAFDGSRYFVAWQTTRPTSNGIPVGHIYGTRVEKEGTAVDGELVICTAFLLQSGPRVAADPKNGFFVVWDDFRTSLDSADVYGGRVSPEGQVLDGDKGRPIATGEADESRATVVSSGDGSGWIVAWRDLRSKQAYDVYGAWVSSAGVNRDPKGFLFSAEGGDEETPALTHGPPDKLLLTYARLDPRTGYGSYRLRARAIDAGKAIAASCTSGDECASRVCADGFCCASDCDGCGTCSATPGTCTPRAAGSESPRCTYRCKGTLECPTECLENSDCASGATCDKASKQCVTRQICIDPRTLQDVTGKQTDCAPYTCVGDACRTSCGSVDDCAQGFVCDEAGRCIPPPNGEDVSACAIGAPAPAGGRRSGTFAAAIAVAIAIASRRRRRPR